MGTEQRDMTLEEGKTYDAVVQDGRIEMLDHKIVYDRIHQHDNIKQVIVSEFLVLLVTVSDSQWEPVVSTYKISCKVRIHKIWRREPGE